MGSSSYMHFGFELSSPSTKRNRAGSENDLDALRRTSIVLVARFLVLTIVSLGAILSTNCINADAFAHASSGHSSGGGGHSSGSHGGGGGYHGGSGYGRNYGRGYGYGYGYGNNGYVDDEPHYYDPGHPVQTGAVFSGPAHIDASQVHYFVQEYHWPTHAAETAQEPRNATGTAYGVQSEPRASGLQNK